MTRLSETQRKVLERMAAGELLCYSTGIRPSSSMGSTATATALMRAGFVAKLDEPERVTSRIRPNYEITNLGRAALAKE